MRMTAATAARRRKTRRSPTKPTAVTALRPTDDVATLIATWTPKQSAAREHWQHIAATTRALVTKAEPGGEEMARKYLSALSRHTAIRYAAGMRVDDAVELLSDDVLAATLGTQADHGLTENSRRTHLSYLRRLRARALPTTYGTAKELTTLAKSPVADAYTAEDVAAMLAWCRTSKNAKAERLHAALLLALACGIDGFESDRVTGHDVLRSPWGLLVRAPGMANSGTRPARLVPVLADYEEDLAALATKAADAPLIGASTRGNYDLARATAKTSSVPVFNAGRGRATWTRSLLVAGVSYLAMRQAGVATRSEGTLHILSKDLTVPMPAYTTALRNGSTAFDASDEAFAGLREWAEQ